MQNNLKFNTEFNNMKRVSSNAFVGALLILCYLLFSSNSCSKEFTDPGVSNCNPTKTVIKDFTQFDAPDSFTLDPPLLRYKIHGVTNVCLEENLKLFARLNLNSGSTATFSSKFLVETPTFATFTIPMESYNAEGPFYQSDISVIAISTLGLKEAGWVNFVAEIGWNTSTSYTSEEELVAYANQNFESFVIITTYNEYKE